MIIKEDNREPVIIGDLHGCLVELQELLKKISFDPNNHRLIFIGDLIDRGNYGPECFKFVRGLVETGQAECCLGNHEEKHFKYRGHMNFGKENPMHLSEKDKDAHMKLSEEDIQWISTLPRKIHIKDNWYALHAGLESALTFENQQPDKIIRCRHLDNSGRAVSLHRYNKSPADYTFWADMWPGQESIIFGHETFKEPKIFTNKNNTCIGIDTGCVYGGFLTAYLFDQKKFVQVKAKEKYYHSNYRDVC